MNQGKVATIEALGRKEAQAAYQSLMNQGKVAT